MGLSAGTRLGPYEIVAPLGAGGMGEVYRARDTRLGRDVAIKVVRQQLASDPERLSRFEKEARAAAQLDHPNILVVHDVGTHEGSPFIVSELLQGESLREKLGAPLPPKKAVDYAIQIAHGLAAAHEKGIVHRDIKPENVFVTKDGHVKILDFGVAKLLPSFESVRRRHGDAHRKRHTARHGRRYGGLHVSRADPRPAGGCPDGPLLVRRRSLRNAVGKAPIPEGDVSRHDVGHPQRGATRPF